MRRRTPQAHGLRRKTPWLPFEADFSALPWRPVCVLIHDVGHRLVGIPPKPVRDIEPMILPSGALNAAGSRLNPEYNYYKNSSDLGTALNTDSDFDCGKRAQGPAWWPAADKPRGIGGNADADEWSATGYGLHSGTAIRARMYANIGITVLCPEHLTSSLTNPQYYYGAYYHEGCAMIDASMRPKIMTQVDGASLSGSTYTSQAALVAAMLAKSETWKINGVYPVSAYDPTQLSLSWWTSFFSALKTTHGFDAFMVPIFNANASAMSPYVTYMSRIDGQKSWATAWNLTNPSSYPVSDWLAALDGDNHTTGNGHYFMWGVRPRDYHTRAGWVHEPEGWKLLKSQFDAAIAGNRPSDGLYMITGDDYLECAEIVPSDRSQYAIYDVCAYYIHWFRSGKRPVIVDDCIYYMHRLHDYNAPPNETYQTVLADATVVGHNPLGGHRYTYRSNGGTPSNKGSLFCFFTSTMDKVRVITAEGTQETTNVPGQTPTIVEFDLPTTLGGNIRFQCLRGDKVVIDMPSAFKFYVVASNKTLPYWQDLLHGSGGSLRYTLGQKGLLPATEAEPVQNCRTHIKGTLGIGMPSDWPSPGWPPPGGALPEPS